MSVGLELQSSFGDFIGETFTTCNDVLRESPVRRATWEVVRTDENTLITSIGSVRYEKTLS